MRNMVTLIAKYETLYEYTRDYLASMGIDDDAENVYLNCIKSTVKCIENMRSDADVSRKHTH